MSVFNLTNLSEASDFVDLFKYGNEVTGDIFVLIILLTVFLVFYIGGVTRGVQSEKSFLVATFVTMISSWLFYAIGMVGVQISVLLLGLLLIAAFIAGRGREE